MKYIGLDIGSKRVGIAVSDDGGTVAFPHADIPRDGCERVIADIITTKGIGTAVIGESLNLDGTDNPVMEDIRAVAAAVEKIVPVIFQQEQYSTLAAARLGKGSDAEAAAIILQSHLDRAADDTVDFG